MEIINSSNPKKPRFVFEGVPENMTPKEKELYWGKEQERWHEGYKKRGQETMDGLLYFYLTQITLVTPQGKFIKPRWRDVEEFVNFEYQEASRLYLDFCMFKRRRAGLSSFFGAGVPIFKFFTLPGSTSLMTSADRGRTSMLYNEKLTPAWNNLHPDIKPRKVTKSRGAMELEVAMRDLVMYERQKEFGKRGEMEEAFGPEGLSVSACRCRQTSDRVEDTANFEGQAAVHMFIDELFLHPYAGKVVASNQATMMDELVKIGPIVMGGSAGVVSAAGIKEAQRLWSGNGKTVRSMFIPGWMGIDRAPEFGKDGQPTGKFLNFCENGYSDEKRATEWILQRRAFLEKYGSEEAQIGWMKSYPLHIDEVFEFNSLGAIPEDIAPRVSKHKIRLTNEPPPVGRYRLYDRHGEVVMEGDPKGDWLILEPPVPEKTYGMGTDPIPMVDTSAMDTATALDTGARSVNSSMIGCLETDMPVALYNKRVNNPSIILNDLVLGQRLFHGRDGCKNMIERNRGGELIREYDLKGLGDMLALQPIVFGPLNMDKRRLRGYNKNHATTDTIYRIFFDALRRGVENISFIDLIEQIPLFLVENTDMVDAYISLMILFEDIRMRNKRKTASIQHEYVDEIYSTFVEGKGVVRQVFRRPVITGAEGLSMEDLDAESQRLINKLRRNNGIATTRQ